MFVARRYRLYPTPQQEEVLHRFIHTCRAIWNLGLEQREVAYRRTGRTPSYRAQCADLQEVRNDPDVAPWLCQVPVQVLQQTLRDLDGAFQRFFQGDVRHPRYRRRSRGGSFRVPQYVRVERLSRRWGRVKLQGLEPVKFRWHRAPVGIVKHATVTVESDGSWWLSPVCEQARRTPTCNGRPPVGVDLGVVVPVATSTGEQFTVRVLREKEAERLLRLQRQLERQMRGSGNRALTLLKISRIRSRARRRRSNFAEQTSNYLTKNHGAVVFEDLNIQAITRSARGSVAAPGRRVRQKAGLNRAILNVGWGAIRRRTEAKAVRRGGHLWLVPAHHTSQTCPDCGRIDPAQRVTRSLYQCGCGYSGHADTTAAKIILQRAIVGGLVLDVAGGTPVAARPGYEPEPPGPPGAEPSSHRAGRGSGNQEMGHRARSAA